MGRQRAQVGCGCFAAIIAGICAFGSIAVLAGSETSDSPTAWWVLALSVLVMLSYAVVKATRGKSGTTVPAQCMVCYGPIGRKVYTVMVNGNRMTTCATCGRQLARKASKQAVERLTSRESR